MAVPFMSLYVTQYLRRPASDAGIIIALYGVGSVLGATAGGKLSDVFGFRPVQIISAIAGGLLFLLYATVTHFSSLCVLTVIISFVGEAFRPANFSAIAAYASPGLQTRSYSLNRLAINLGWAVGGSLGGIIASINYQLLFVVDGVVSIVAGLCILWWLPSGKALHKAVKEKMKSVTVRKPWQDGLFMQFIFLNMLFTTCFFLIFRVVPLFYKEIWHINESAIGLILGLNGIIIAVLEMVMVSRWENRHSPFYYIIIGVLFTAASYALLFVPGFLPVATGICSMVLATFGEMFALPFINTFVMSRTNEFNRGQYAAGYTLSWSFAQLIGPIGGFYLAENFGYHWLWIVLICILIICAAGFKKMQGVAEADLKRGNPL